MTQIRVKDFGPIAEASFELKPLTVFMGPNGTGKSYLALAAYCLFRTLAGQVNSSPFRTAFRLPAQEGSQSQDLLRRIEEEAKKAWPNARSMPRSRLSMEAMPERLQRVLGELQTAAGDGLTSAFASDLERCFGAKTSDLVKRGVGISPTHLETELLHDDSNFNWGVTASVDHVATKVWSGKSLEQGLDLAHRRVPWRMFIDDPGFFLMMAVSEREFIIPSELLLRTHYMPASRYGILLGHKSLAGFIVGQASRAWLRPIDIPRLPGVITDLIQALLLMDRRAPADAKLQDVLAYLEGSIMKGSVDIEMDAEYPEIYYENESGRYMLHQVSSMVSEIAPIVLYLKYQVRPGDLFIIEEPESHVDAENQRGLARAIAMLVSAGVKVLITTHSDYFVNQLSNLLLLSAVTPRRRAARGYSAHEVLNPSDVGAYFFRAGEEGTVVKTLEVTADGGIPTEQFSEVHSATYDEAIALEHTII